MIVNVLNNKIIKFEISKVYYLILITNKYNYTNKK